MASKYYSKKVVTEDGTFDSKKEYKRWLELKSLEKRGIITELKRQQPFELIPRQKLPYPKMVKGRRINYEHAVKYVADFSYFCDGNQIVEDTKGFKTTEYIIKRKLMLNRYGIQVKEI